MTTQSKIEIENQDCSTENLKNFLTSLENFPCIESYQQLGFTLESLSKVLQTALMTEIFSKESTEHSKWDIFNLLKLIHSLIPRPELELLDQLKRMMEDQ